MAMAPDYAELDQQSMQLRDKLFFEHDEMRKAAKDAAGYIVFPNVTKAGLVVGGMKGDGTLFVKGNIVGHYQVTGASWGLQAGVQSFSMIMYFMTPEALTEFRSSDGFELGTDVEYALPNYGAVSIGASSATYNRPVYALIFDQKGVMVGASLRGAVYRPI